MSVSMCVSPCVHMYMGMGMCLCVYDPDETLCIYT